MRRDAQERGPVVLVQRLHQPRVIERVLPERGRDAQRVRGGGLVLEASRVGDEPGVQARGGLVRHRAAHRVDQAVDHLARGGRGRVDERDRAEPVVRPMVIDPDELAGAGCRPTQRTEPVEGCAVARDHDGRRVREVAHLDEVLGPGKEPRPARQHERLVRERAHGGRSPLTEERREPEHRAERVGVRVQVARQCDVGRRSEDLRGARHVIHRTPPPRLRRRSAVAIRRSIVAACSSVASSSNASSGRNFIRTCLPITPRSLRDGRAETRPRGRALLVVAERRVVDPRATEVGGDLHARHGHEPDAWVLQLRDLLRQDLAELFPDAFDPRSLRHGPSVPAPDDSHVSSSG